MVEETCAGGFMNSSAFCPQGKEGYQPCLYLLCYLPCHLIDTRALTISAALSFSHPHQWIQESYQVDASLWNLNLTLFLTFSITYPPGIPTSTSYTSKSIIKVLSTFNYNCLLLLCSHSVMSNSLQPHGLQHTRLLCPPLSPTVCSNSCPLSLWCYLTISSSAIPFSFAFSLSQHQGLFQWVSSLHKVTKVLELQLKHQSFQWIFRVDFL